MPIDASIYNNLNTKPYNPLEVVGQVTGVSNAMQQNKLLQTQNQQSTADLAMKQYEYLNNVIGNLNDKATSEEGITHNEMINAALDAKNAGMISDDGFKNFVAGLGADTKQNNAATTARLQYATQDAAKKHAITYGAPIAGTIGSQQFYGTQQDPQHQGRLNIATELTNELTPGEQAARVPAIVNGAQGSVPQSSLVTPTGMPKSAPSQQGVISAESDINAPRSLSSIAADRVPESSVPALPSGAVQSSFPPGVPEAAAQVGSIAGQNLANDITALNHSPDTLYGMESAGKALQNATTGKGSEYRNALKSYVTAFAPDVFKNTDWEHDVEAYDKANKYLTQQAQRLGSQIGPNTNESMATAAKGSPNTHINNLTSQELQAVTTGLTRMNYARTAAFQYENPNGTPHDYQGYGQKFNQSVDPRGFMVDLLPKAQASKLLKELGKPILPDGKINLKRQKFDRAYDMAVQYGFMNHIAGQ